MFVFEVGNFPISISNRSEGTVYIVDFCSNLSSTLSNGSSGANAFRFLVVEYFANFYHIISLTSMKGTYYQQNFN